MSNVWAVVKEALSRFATWSKGLVGLLLVALYIRMRMFQVRARKAELGLEKSEEDRGNDEQDRNIEATKARVADREKARLDADARLRARLSEKRRGQ